MKAIILAAGKGSRLAPLTDNIPKPMIKIVGKSILEHNLEYIYNYVNEIIIVVKHGKEIIKETFGDNYKGVSIKYFEQGDEKGTAAAIFGIELEGDLVLLYGDTIYSEADIENIVSLKSYGVLVKEVENPEKYGIYKKDSNGLISEVVEKPKEFIGNLAGLGMYKFNSSILELVKKIKKSERGEYELTDAINLFVKDNNFEAVESKEELIDITYPWDILSANKYFLDKLDKSEIKGTVEEGVTIKGNIVLEDGATIKSGTYIEGNCYFGAGTIVGPNAYVRGNTVTGKNCKIGASVEVKNISLGDKSNIPHLSYIGDSIIGKGSNMGGATMTANKRHDDKNIRVMIKGELVDSSNRKLGAIIGDNVQTGVKTIIYPGRILESNSTTLPGEIVK